MEARLCEDEWKESLEAGVSGWGVLDPAPVGGNGPAGVAGAAGAGEATVDPGNVPGVEERI